MLEVSFFALNGHTTGTHAFSRIVQELVLKQFFIFRRRYVRGIR